MYAQSDLSVAEAIENLSNIIDFNLDGEILVFNNQLIVSEGVKKTQLASSQCDSVKDRNDERTVLFIKNIFRVILNFVRQNYRDIEVRGSKEGQKIEGIKAVMLLVGEAAERLDCCTALYKNSHWKGITALEEFRQLQGFYRKKFEKQILGKSLSWGDISRYLSGKAIKPLYDHRRIEIQGMDKAELTLEMIRQDTNYELLYLKKSNGGLFYHECIINSLKLMCNFEKFLDEEFIGHDPFIQVRTWYDKSLQVLSKEILSENQSSIDAHYKKGGRYKKAGLARGINKIIMALMLSSNPKNLLRKNPCKSSYCYFKDFLFYLRQVLTSEDYQYLVNHPPSRNSSQTILLTFIHKLCEQLYTRIPGEKELYGVIRELIEKGLYYLPRQKTKSFDFLEDSSFWMRLAKDYQALEYIIEKFPHGPLFKAFDQLHEDDNKGFDVFLDNNLPQKAFNLLLDQKYLQCIKVPSPTFQYFIHKAYIIEEFKGFLRSYGEKKQSQKHLIFNLQDRTNWTERARSQVLEDLPNHAEFCYRALTVTLNKETSFYNQSAPYDHIHSAKNFMNSFLEQLKSKSSGFCFPKNIDEEIFSFARDLMLCIHETFFQGNVILQRKDRLNFIELFYFFLELKIIEKSKPSSFSFTCKDAVDVAPCAMAGFYILCKLLTGKKFVNKDQEFIYLMLFSPALINRDRMLNLERFTRLLDMVKTVEQALKRPSFLKKLRSRLLKLYDKKTLHMHIYRL